MRTLVEESHVDPHRYAQVGLRGFWPGERALAWQSERGLTSLFMHDVRDLGIKEVVRRALAAAGDGPAYLTVDIDVLDPSFVPGMVRPSPPGLTSADLLWAVREVARRLARSAACRVPAALAKAVSDCPERRPASPAG